MMEKGNNLLAGYLAERSEESFRAIVREHSAMVQATAARRLNGELAVAQDVSQQVFIRLAKSAPKLSGVCLAGWLYRQACRLSADHVRGEQRRKTRETTAADLMMKTPSVDQAALTGEIDQALGQLPAGDRDAIVLRYLEEKSHRSVGEQLGISEEAARKKCARAVESLRDLFSKRGLGVSTTVVVVSLSALATPPLPAATIAVISKASFAKSSTSLFSLGGLLSFVGGAAAASLAAGGIYTVQTKVIDDPSSSVVLSTRSVTGLQTKGVIETTAKKEISVETVIAELRRLYLEPRNVMNTMRVSALFDALPAGERVTLSEQINEQLQKHERDFAIKMLVTQWMARGYEKAFDGVIQVGLMKNGHNNNLGTYEWLFRQWVSKSPAEAEQWLKKNWNHEDLKIVAFESNVQSDYAHEFIRRTLREHGVSAAFAKIREFGGAEDFEQNLKALTGTTWYQVNLVSAVEVYQELSKLPNIEQRSRLVETLFKNWKEDDGSHFQASLSRLHPSDRIGQSLVMLSYRAPQRIETRYANGDISYGVSQLKLAADENAAFLEKREIALRQISAEAGISEAEIDRRIVAQYFSEKNERSLDLLDRLQPGEESDQVILDGALRLCQNHDRGVAHSEVMAFNAALSISDPARRIGAVRALYQRIRVKSPSTAKDMASYSDFPADISTALQEILATETP